MNKSKWDKQIILSGLAMSLITAFVTAILLMYCFSLIQFQEFGDFCRELTQRHPECRQMVLEVLKSKHTSKSISQGENILALAGYRPLDFLHINRTIAVLAGVGFAVGVFCFLCFFLYRQKKVSIRIQTLTHYLEKINTGAKGLILETSEDEFSGLQDEIYKTVTTLYQTREEALLAKKNFAENLSNIAHQIKTPITAISLLSQMIKEPSSANSVRQIKQQTDRLTHLEEALLLLSRVDAGTLVMRQNPVDVFTLLTLAADHLSELFSQAKVSVDIPEMGEVEIAADLEWSMEAVINLLKNGMEHTPENGTVHCSYEKNPLYVQIQIWNEGEGFAKEDLPHLFERFYRGKHETGEGIGIGLSLAKSMIELQNGVIRAYNLPSKAACFEIRFYKNRGSRSTS